MCRKLSSILSMFSFLFSFLGSQAQSINYCISGRFAENDFYSPLAIVSTYDLVYGNNNDYQGINQDLKLDSLSKFIC